MRRLLLTSAGLRNDSLRDALAGLREKPFADARVAFVPTASVAQGGDHGWFVEDLHRLHGLGWRELDLVELNGLPRAIVVERLRRADVVYAEGGNHYHLARSMVANDLAKELGQVLETVVWVGVSAGSMQFSRKLSRRTGLAFGEHADLEILDGAEPEPAFDWFDWYLKPHLGSPAFPERTHDWFEAAVADLDFPVYALDDDSAVRVRGDDVDVVSEGEWRLLNAPAS